MAIHKVTRSIWMSARTGTALLDYDHDTGKATLLIDREVTAEELADLADAIGDLPMEFWTNDLLSEDTVSYDPTEDDTCPPSTDDLSPGQVLPL